MTRSAEKDAVPCHWTHRHGPHEWTPLVADPDSPRVLHLFGEWVRCPGKGRVIPPGKSAAGADQ